MDFDEPVTQPEKTILIIDDSSTVRRYLRHLFAGEFPSIKLIEAAEGRAALNEMTRCRPDLIVTDLNMPGMDGRAFIAKLRSNPLLKKKSMIVLSSEDMAELRRQYASDPGIRFLVKPSGTHEILGAAKDLLGTPQQPPTQLEEAMNSMTATPLESPGAFGLFELIDAVISDWAFLGSQMAGIPAPGPAQMELEYSVRLKGAVDCLLVLRSHAGLGQVLAEASTGDPGAREEGEDAFKELCNLAASHFLSRQFPEASFAPFLPSPSAPASWPAREADCACVLICENYPLEARLWLNLPSEAAHV